MDIVGEKTTVWEKVENGHQILGIWKFWKRAFFKRQLRTWYERHLAKRSVKNSDFVDFTSRLPQWTAWLGWSSAHKLIIFGESIRLFYWKGPFHVLAPSLGKHACLLDYLSFLQKDELECFRRIGLFLVWVFSKRTNSNVSAYWTLFCFQRCQLCGKKVIFRGFIWE